MDQDSTSILLQSLLGGIFLAFFINFYFLFDFIHEWTRVICYALTGSLLIGYSTIITFAWLQYQNSTINSFGQHMIMSLIQEISVIISMIILFSYLGIGEHAITRLMLIISIILFGIYLYRKNKNILTRGWKRLLCNIAISSFSDLILFPLTIEDHDQSELSLLITLVNSKLFYLFYLF